LVMVWSVAQSVAGANWADGLDVLVLVALPALLIGTLFARLPWLPGWLAHTLSGILGLVWSVQAVGPLLQNEVRGQLGAALADRLANWSDRASEVLIRSISLGRIVQAGGRGEDIVLFIVALALLFWLLGYASGWLLFRADWTWAAVVLNAMVILINYTFTLPKPTTLFFVFLVAALLLIVHQHIVQQQRRWSAALIDFPEWMPMRFLTAAALAVGAVALITALLPGQVSVAEAARTWRLVSSPFTAVREGWETAFSTIQAPPGTSGGGFFARSMRVGGGRALGDNIVLRVQSPTYDYWRAITRDRYNGRSWDNTVGERARSEIGATTAEAARTPLDAGMIALDPSLIQGRTLVTQSISLAQDRSDSMLVMGGEFRSSGIPVLVEHGFVNPGSGPLPNFIETSRVFAQVPLQNTTTYTVASYMSTASVDGLRSAGQEYPAWITQAYLQVPESLPQRVRDLASEIVGTAGATTPYDKAAAVQAHLRTFTYDEGRAAPPTNVDWADHFLFEMQKGYCDDFATAMIVMLRAEGVPARLAQGYAGGTLDPQIRAYVVRESVAHSWPEVYFPGYGWQRFEPTPASYANVPLRPTSGGDELPNVPLGSSLPEQYRDRDFTEEDLQSNSAENAATAAAAAEALRAAELSQRLLFSIGLLGLLAGLVVLAWYQLNRNLRGLSPATAAYARMTRLGGWAGLRAEEHQTPHEYAAKLAKTLPEQQQHVDQIVGGYVQERYNASQPAAIDIDYDGAWKTVRRPLLARLFGRPFERKPGAKTKRPRGG
ncbi:MAG: transglutaminase domain-containing protein, partial [Roseiflexaceae bacterium]|nr:transglutaminase domain-containing protein [Roseiflexaceae bacterium]